MRECTMAEAGPNFSPRYEFCSLLVWRVDGCKNFVFPYNHLTMQPRFAQRLSKFSKSTRVGLYHKMILETGWDKGNTPFIKQNINHETHTIFRCRFYNGRPCTAPGAIAAARC